MLDTSTVATDTIDYVATSTTQNPGIWPSAAVAGLQRQIDENLLRRTAGRN